MVWLVVTPYSQPTGVWVRKYPTSVQSPDATQGGGAVTSPIVTGHSGTNCSASNGTSQIKSARWFDFPFSGTIIQITLQANWSHNASRSGSASNNWTIQYSLNAGSSWLTADSRTNVSGASSGSVSIPLSITQDITQVQVRDSIFVDAPGVGDSASMTFIISSIRLALTTQDAGMIVAM
jgi:hypothetical protein